MDSDQPRKEWPKPNKLFTVDSLQDRYNAIRRRPTYRTQPVNSATPNWLIDFALEDLDYLRTDLREVSDKSTHTANDRQKIDKLEALVDVLIQQSIDRLRAHRKLGKSKQASAIYPKPFSDVMQGIQA
jgi:hypothetical protein